MEQFTIDELLTRARASLERVSVSALADELAAGALLVDIRPVGQRDRNGILPGALVIDRNVLEWRLAPSSEHRLAGIEANTRVILVCDEGYSSSLAAATLQHLGLGRATDLIGGYQAWLSVSRG
jgi:rhodanese-related sulfurtransferase